MVVRSCGACGAVVLPWATTCPSCAAPLEQPPQGGSEPRRADHDQALSQQAPVAATDGGPAGPADDDALWDEVRGALHGSDEAQGPGWRSPFPDGADPGTSRVGSGAARVVRLVAATAGVALVMGVVVVGLAAMADRSDPNEAAVLEGRGEWDPVTSPDGAFRISLPAGEVTTEGPTDDGDGARRSQLWVGAGGSLAGVTTFNYDSDRFAVAAGPELVGQVPAVYAGPDGTVAWTRPREVAGHGAVEFVVEADDGTVETVAAFLTGQRLYYVWVESDRQSTAALDRMVEGLVLLPAD